jgi:glycosyltransferase involved in cell wall biosynthesis
MKKTLAMIVKDEEPMLSRTLPLMAPLFDEIVALDAESKDRTVEILRHHKAKVEIWPWKGDYSFARNGAINLATGDAIFMFDADEVVLDTGLEVVARALRNEPAASLPRIEFVYDVDHYNPGLWPDWQCRFFRADARPRFIGRVHECLVVTLKSGHDARAFEIATHVEACPIYHYGQTKPVKETVLRHYNYGRIQKGLAPAAELPEGYPVELHHNVSLFPGKHPLSNHT